MTTAELNRDIKKLLKLYAIINSNDFDSKEYKDAYGKLTNEFKRLYFADTKFEYMNVQSIRIMLRLNLRFRFYQLHTFGLMIEI